MTRIDMYRLIADEGKILTDGTNYTKCVDTFVTRAERWTEIDDPEANEDQD